MTSTTVLQLADLFLCSIYSTVDSFSLIFISILASSVLFFFIVSNSLLKTSNFLLFASFWVFGSSLRSLSRTLSQVGCLSPCYLALFLRFYFVPLSPVYSSAASFCLSCYFNFYLCGGLVRFLDLGEEAFYRRCAMYLSSALPSCHPSYMP